MRAEIGRQIRAMYDDVVNEGVPNRFSDLLTRLDTNANRSGA